MTENIEPTINVIGYMIRAIAGGARRFALLCAGETLREEVGMVVDRLIGCPWRRHAINAADRLTEM
jgi:hypothetical protein